MHYTDSVKCALSDLKLSHVIDFNAVEGKVSSTNLTLGPFDCIIVGVQFTCRPSCPGDCIILVQ